MKEYVCKGCNESLPLDNYYEDKRLLTGHSRYCKACTKARKGRRKQVYAREEAPKVKDSAVVTLPAAIEERSNTLTSLMLKSREPVVVEKQEYPVFDWIAFFKRRLFAAIKFCGSRGAGKSTLLQHLWPLFRIKFDMTFLYSMSLMGEAYDFLSDEDREIAFDDFIPSIFSDCDRLQRKLKRPLKIFHIMDDCSDDTIIKYNGEILQKHIRGRNSNEAILTSDQSPTFLNKNSRNNIDLLVLGKFLTPDMYDTVSSLFLRRSIPIPPQYYTKSKQDEYMAEWLRVHTLDHQFIIVDFMDNRKIYQYKVNGELDLSNADTE